jgi:hypothetical protein
VPVALALAAGSVLLFVSLKDVVVIVILGLFVVALLMGQCAVGYRAESQYFRRGLLVGTLLSAAVVVFLGFLGITAAISSMS